MNYLNRAFILLLPVLLLFAPAEGKAPALQFDGSVKETLHSIGAPIGCEQVTIKNEGEGVVFDCFPSEKESALVTIQDLRASLKESSYPLLTLYRFWSESVTKIDTDDRVPYSHPLDLVNFSGACNAEDFETYFLKLCRLLDISIRTANMRGKTGYDFSCKKGEWSYLDLTTGTIYPNFDNTTLASSEQIADDPLLALRVRHPGELADASFDSAWKELARFEILEPGFAPPVLPEVEPLELRAKGFSLYPEECLVFALPAGYTEMHSDESELSDHQAYVEHHISLKNRPIDSDLEYTSPIPLRKITNDTFSSVYIKEIDRTLSPGETFFFHSSPVFEITLSFSSSPEGNLVVSGLFSRKRFLEIKRENQEIRLGSEKNPSLVTMTCTIDSDSQDHEAFAAPIVETEKSFDYTTPYFLLNDPSGETDTIRWQISSDKNFDFIPPNLDRIGPFSSIVTLSEIDESFLSPEELYFFRIKGKNLQGHESEWSESISFSVAKPQSIEEIEFDETSDGAYELNWVRFSPETEGAIEYLVFGSNSFDFIPSVYCDKQINGMVNGEVIEDETNDNLTAITTRPKIRVSGHLAYYRIIAREKGKLSVPSSIVHVYAPGLYQPRNVLQLDDRPNEPEIAKRTLIPLSASSSAGVCPLISPKASASASSFGIHALARSVASLQMTDETGRASPSYISPEVWQAVSPWLIPDNHPCKAKLDRLASEQRFILNPKEMKRAGFPRAERVGHYSRVCASPHRDMPDYYFKAYHDCELNIRYDWKRWIHRCEGADLIRKCIKEHKLQRRFKVPRKWIYCWPANGKQAPKSSRYLKKNFILVCDNMNISDHSTNKKLYKKKLDQKWLSEMYLILQKCGLCDSVYCFNMPFNKEEKSICIIDTEFWHKWPVHFERLTKNFSKKMRPYWERLTKSGKIPDGVNSPNNLPRLDRRDRPSAGG